MKEDIQEIKDIIKELQSARVLPSDHEKAIDLAVRIQTNRILRKGLVINWRKTPQSLKEETSIIEYFDQTFIDGFANINGTLEEIVKK